MKGSERGVAVDSHTVGSPDSHRDAATVRLTRVIGLSAAALFLPVVLPLLVGRVFVFDDLSAFHIPLRHLYQEALAAGDTVLWTPSILAHELGTGLSNCLVARRVMGEG